MEEKTEHINQLFNKKLSGELNLSEENEFNQWLSESSENELLFRRMMDVWQKSQSEIRIKGQNATFQKISRQLDFNERSFDYTSYGRSKKNRTIWYKIAAVITFLLVATSIFYFNTSPKDDVQRNVYTEMIYKNNPAGQKTRINLPDGSVCWLNSESEIKFPPNLSKNSREIYLKGEAYFEVAKDADRPFRVHSPTMIITALGTIFNVNSFNEEENESVALIEGSISVKCKDKFYNNVMPGESISFNKKAKYSKRLEIDADAVINWKNGILNFNEESYQTIFSKLERWYGVSISISGNPPSHLKYKASFKNGLLDNILNSISYGHEFEYKIDGKKIKIMFN